MFLKHSPVFREWPMRNKKGNHGANGRVLLMLCALFLFFHSVSSVKAAILSSSGSWVENIGSSDLIFGAGSDLTDTYTSPIAATTLEVSGCAEQTEEWQILIKRVDQIWDSGRFVLWVKRTSMGTGVGTVTGGDSFLEVKTSDAIFLTGQGDRSGITIQYQLSGVSVQTLPDNYNTVVEFTITP